MRPPLPAFTKQQNLLQRKDKDFLKTKPLSPPQTIRQEPLKSIVAPAFTKKLCPPTPKIAPAEGKLAILAPLETNEYGQRHFITVDPNGML
ncbi:MAG: hypothetical protein LBC09_07850, partial [Helicobacteraceae bacterium]|nr:hypothetical protein [Helicobacteraceae bacterium]